MFKPGDKVDLTYYEFDEQVESHGWMIEEYDNGLMKVVGHANEVVVFNLRSIGFLKVEVSQ